MQRPKIQVFQNGTLFLLVHADRKHVWIGHHLLCDCFGRISCSQPQEDLPELHQRSPWVWRVSLVWGSKSLMSDCTGKWCPNTETLLLPPEEKCLRTAQMPCNGSVVAELVPPSTLVSQCYKSQCDPSSQPRLGILQPQQRRTCWGKEQKLVNLLWLVQWTDDCDRKESLIQGGCTDCCHFCQEEGLFQACKGPHPWDHSVGSQPREWGVKDLIFFY